MPPRTKEMATSSLGFLTKTILPASLMLLTPNIVVCVIYFVVTYGSSVAHVSKIGFPTFWYDAWTSHGLGTFEIWTFFAVFVAYSGLSIIVLPGKLYYGPITATGHRPSYRKTGFLYYVITMSLVAYLLLIQDTRCWSIYRNLPGAAVFLTVFGLVVSVLLFIKGKLHPSPGEHGSSGNLVFDIYWGLELYPRIGEHMDVKQWTNSRFGMMIWQLLVLVSWKAQVEDSGWNWAMAATATLQTLYIAKFYWWEDGYMQTIDIIVDRAGFYICWGCICFLTMLYPLTSLYMVEHSPDASAVFGLATISVGAGLIGMNYWCDYQRQIVRALNGKCTIWGKPARVIRATYRDESGKMRSNLLLASGFWSLSRHINYVWEILSALCWCMPAGLGSILPYIYVLYLTGLLVHRSFRDQEKCAKKYKQSWEEYCSLVKYRIVPFIF